MKIAVIAPTEIPSRRANSMQVMKMTQAFIRNGHDARIVSPVPKKLGDQKIITYGTTDGLVRNELMTHYGLHLKFQIEWLPAHQCLRRYDYSISAIRWARKWSADVIYTRLPQAAALSSILGIGTILEVHDLPQGTFGKRLFRRFLRGRGSRRLVVITNALANDLITKFDIPKPNILNQQINQENSADQAFSIIAPDGVDLDRFKDLHSPIQARKTLNRGIGQAYLKIQIPEEKFIVGYTGHLYAGRGIGLILSLAKLLPEMTFLLVGGEPDQISNLSELAQMRSIDNIILAGFAPNAILPLYQAACNVLIMPYQRRVEASSGGDISRYLSPMKLFEYMACGRAILSSNLAVLKEILNKENSVLLPPDNVEAWCNALKDLEGNPDLRRRLAEQAYIDVKKFTWEARAQRILEGILP